MLDRNCKILIAEDESIVALNIKRLLQRFGVEDAGIVGSAEEAIAVAGRLDPDVILMDVRLGGAMDGIEAARELRRTGDWPIIFITAHSDQETLARAVETEPYGYIIKPVKEMDLYTALRVCLIRHEGEKKLRESEERYRSLIREIQDGYFQTDAEGRFVEGNDNFAAMIGRDNAGDLPGLSLFDCFDRESLPGVRENFNIVLRTGSTNRISETRLRGRGGLSRYVAIRAYPVRIGGVTKGVWGTVRDIGERVMAENALRESERRFREMAEFLPQPVFEVGLDGMLQYTNRAGLEFAGITLDDIERGVPVADLVLPEERERLERNMALLLRGQGATGNEYAAWRSGSGNAHVLIYAGLITREGVPLGFRGVMVDISRHRSAMDEIVRSEERYRCIVEGIPDIVLTTDRDLRVTYAGPSIERILGYEASRILGNELAQYFSEPSPGFFQGLAVPSDRIAKPLRLDALHSGGRRVPMEVSFIPLREALRGFIVIARDLRE